MTMRSITFGGPIGDEPPLQAHQIANGKDHSGEELNPILKLGELVSDHKLLGEQIKHLPVAPADYHGTLQVALSAARRIAENLEKLIGAYSGKHEDHLHT